MGSKQKPFAKAIDIHKTYATINDFRGALDFSPLTNPKNSLKCTYQKEINTTNTFVLS